jgi:hypothetical protein
MIDILVRIGIFVFIFALFATVFIKLFERRLTFVQAVLIAGWCLLLATVLLTIYFALKPMLGLPASVDGIATIAWMALAGTLITRQAQKYGFKKSGWLGLGAKVMLSILALSWVFVGIYLLIHYVA